jgi:putative ABC transport system permease protein
MRFGDLLRLAASALARQKLRSSLTGLGVVLGAFVLVVSLSLGQGVQETIEREAHRGAHLRRVRVQPVWTRPDEDPSAEKVQVRGKMSEEKRERIRKALSERQRRTAQAGQRVPLDRRRLAELAAIEHVESVTPLFHFPGWAMLDGHSHGALIVSAAPDNPYYRDRVVAGSGFDSADERSVLLGEVLCYQLGFADDDAVNALVGRPLRLEFRSQPPAAGLVVYVSRPEGGEPTRAEALALEKVRRRLPEALDRLGLSPAEQEALRSAGRGGPPRTVQVRAQEYTIRGVLQPAPEDRPGLWEPLNVDADVVLPVGTAEDVYFRVFTDREAGANAATVVVDRDENVRDVARRIEAMKLNAYAPIEYIERERLIYRLVFGAMTCVAAVALLVAALGIANTMLIGVLERTREIGIMKAVGGSEAQLQLVFLLEGACIGLVGGGLGLLLAWAGSFPGDAWMRSLVSRDLRVELKESLFVFPAWLVAGAWLFAVLVTTLAALYPARRAARVSPVEALRHE